MKPLKLFQRTVQNHLVQGKISPCYAVTVLFVEWTYFRHRSTLGSGYLKLNSKDISDVTYCY